MRTIRPAPGLGEHNRQVLGGLLGLGDEALGELEARQIIGDRPAVELPVHLIGTPSPEKMLELDMIQECDRGYRKVLGLDERDRARLCGRRRR